MADEKRSRGRPNNYSQDIADKVIASVSEGATLRDTCLDLKIAPSTVRGWVLDDREGFSAAYARAKDLQLEAWADDLLTVATDNKRDTTTRRGRDGEEYEVPDNEWIARSRLIVDTKKWLMSKIAPKKYGDRVDGTVTHEAGDTLAQLIKGIRTGQ